MEAASVVPEGVDECAASKGVDEHVSSKEGDECASSKEADEHASPKEADEHASPKEGDEHASPKEADEHTSPKEADEHSSPKEADEHASPKEGDNLEPESDGTAKSKRLIDEELSKEAYENFQEPIDGFIDVLGNGQLKKKVVKPGTPGSRPSDGSMVTAKVKIYLESDRCVHDATETFFMGQGDVIAAIDMTSAMMDEGEVAIIQTAARFGYGSSGREPDIPGDASLTVKVELLKVQPPPDINTMPAEDLLKFGERKRARGNDLFSRGEFSAAIGAYSGAVRFFEAGDRQLKGEETVLQQIEDNRLKTYNNMAAAQLKIGASCAVIRSCNIVLGRQPDNVKALYRIGKAYCAKGEMDKAIDYLKRAIKQDPESKLLHRELSSWTQKRKAEMESEKQMYRKMLGSAAGPFPKDNKKPEGSSMLKVSLIIGSVMAAMFSVGFAYYRSTH